jgi:hypothetical protein
MKKVNLYLLVAALAAAGYAWLGWNIVEQHRHAAVETLCLFKEATGIPCPSCGTTRSVEEVMRGNFSGAFITNPLGFLAVGMLLIFPVWIAIDFFRKNDSFFRFYQWIEFTFSHRLWISVPAVILLLANWGWNIMKGL